MIFYYTDNLPCCDCGIAHGLLCANQSLHHIKP